MSDEVKKSLGRFVIDIETNNLLSNMLDYSSLPYKLNKDARLWCIVLRDIDTDEVKELVSESGGDITRKNLEGVLEGVTELVGHNAIKFDMLTLKLFGVLDYEIGYLHKPDKVFGKEVKVTDTLVRSRLLNPDRKGGHGLAAWGKVLGDFKGDFHDFSKFTPEMLSYCIQDTKVTSLIFDKLEREYQGYIGWKKAEKLENKLADIAIRRETYGFWFDKEKAIACVEELTQLMQDLANNVNPLLPPKPMTKGNLKKFTPPKKQVNQDGSISALMEKFAIRHDAIIEDDLFIYKGLAREIPFTEPLETHEVADISDLDHVKSYLIELGWRPMEMKIRDLTKDSKKQTLPYEKRVETLDRWLKQTFDEGKYKEVRLRELDMGVKVTKEVVRKTLLPKLEKEYPVRVPTSPCVRVGVEKELCPNLVKIGDKVAFAKDFVLYQTYKHRKSCIAGGDIDDMDFDEEYPNTGYLSMYREADERVSTPAIEIGAGCVVRDSELITFKGVKKVVDIEVGDEVLTHEGVYEKVTDLINNGIKPVYKITLENNLSLTCTDNHPFMTECSGWVRLRDLDIKKHKILFYGEVERWGQHKRFKNYSVSSWGKVLNKYGKEISPMSDSKNLAVYVDLYNGEGEKNRISLGRLVCEVFTEDCPEGLEVRHLDGNTYNNNIQNLKFGTSKENSQDALKHRYRMKKRRATTEIVTDEQVVEIRNYYEKNGYNRGDDELLAEKYGISRKYINEIRRYKRRIITPPYQETYHGSVIKSIEYVGEQPTYDITVKKDHSYVVNGMVTHNTSRYRHIGIANIPRVTSVYGEPMRSLFGCGKSMFQFGFDFSSLEARIQGHYVLPFNGKELAKSLLAEKPNDLHTINANKLGMSRGDAKAIAYMLIYGGSSKKAKTMLGITQEEADTLVNDFWEEVKPLKDLKEALTAAWKKRGKTYIVGVDGRKINIRSQHSLINFLFQSGGVICAKYSTVFMYQLLEEKGYNCNPFEHKEIDVSSMIEYHKSCGFA